MNDSNPNNTNIPSAPTSRINIINHNNTNTLQASQYQTDCSYEQRNSLQCINDNYDTKDITCQPYYQAYKDCRKIEHERKLDEKQKQRQMDYEKTKTTNSWNLLDIFKS